MSISSINQHGQEYTNSPLKINGVTSQDLREESLYNQSQAMQGGAVEQAKANVETDQKERWEREDEIRKHIEEREDTAYQRAIDDARRAGINPNLYNVQPAGSGGGITNASTKDQTEYTQEMEKHREAIKAWVDNGMKVSELTTEIATAILAVVGGMSSSAISAAL